MMRSLGTRRRPVNGSSGTPSRPSCSGVARWHHSPTEVKESWPLPVIAHTTIASRVDNL
jgi:hypothetical protein